MTSEHRTAAPTDGDESHCRSASTVRPGRARRPGLADALEHGEFAVTAEIMPPRGPDAESFVDQVRLLVDRVHAINLTDCSRAVLRMSSLAACALVLREGGDPVLQMTCRDRNTLALQADLIGAAGIGVRSVLALTGDGVRHGDHPEARPVFEVESIGLLQIMRRLNQSQSATGRALNASTRLLPGAVVNPNPLPGRSHRKRFAKKVEAGARFFQTQMLTDLDAFADFMAFARPLGAAVLGGVLVIKSLKNARFLNEKVPGIKIGDDILERFAAHDHIDTGIEIAAEQVRACRELCEGVHIMALGREDVILDVLDRAGL